MMNGKKIVRREKGKILQKFCYKYRNTKEPTENSWFFFFMVYKLIKAKMVCNMFA